MKNFLKATFILLGGGLLAAPLAQANPDMEKNFRTGNKIRVQQDVNGNLYACGGEVTASTRILGDAVLCGGKIHLGDSVFGDVLVAGGEVHLKAHGCDDVRAFTGKLEIHSDISGDLTVFGGQVTVLPGVTIGGDVLIMGGEVNLEGDVMGSVHIRGGEVDFKGTIGGDLNVHAGDFSLDGMVMGNAVLSCSDIELAPGSMFHGDLRYSRKGGELDLSQVEVMGTATFDPSLRKWKSASKGAGYWWAGIWGVIISLLMAAVILGLWLHFGNAWLERARVKLGADWLGNMGYGLIYWVLVPIVAIVLCITVIGLPVGLLALVLWGFSFWLAPAVVGGVLVHWYRLRYNKDWGRNAMFFGGLLAWGALKLLGLIPFLGWILVLLVMLAATGALWRTARAKAGKK